MGKRFKPVLALVLSLFMSVSALSNTYTVFAEEETTVQTEEQTSEDNSTEENNSNDEDDSQNTVENGTESDEQIDVNTNEVNEEENKVEAQNDEVKESSEKEGDSNMMDYFLVDNPTLNSGATENFVLSLANANVYSNFSITVQKTDGTTFDLEASEQVDKLVKFTKNFSSADKGEYSVTTLHYSYNGEKYYLNFSDLGMDVKFGVDQEYSGYDETLPDMTKIVAEDDELNQGIIQVTNLKDASDEVAEGIAASNPAAAMALIDEDDISAQDNEGITICLDPGHGGEDSGAVGINNVYEKNLTFKIAQYCKQELEKYNCNVVMTRTGDTNPSLEERADYAKSQGAQYLISIHLNSGTGSAVGAEVYYPNTHWRPDISENGRNVAQNIQNQLASLGIYDRGIKFRTIDTNVYPDPFRYDDGSVADYYSIIRNAKYNGLTGIIIEHCFINSVSDYNNYLSSDAKLQKLGIADANGIVNALGLTQGFVDSADSTHCILYQTHVQDFGWQSWKSNGQVSGTVGQSKRLEAINIKLSNINGDVKYKTHVQDYGWQDWKSNGEMSGTSGEAKRLEAIRIKLSGEAADQYDVYYRVHAEDYGWLDWAENGECAGTESCSKRLEGIQIVLIKKGGKAPGSTNRPFVNKTNSDKTHVQDIGWEKIDGKYYYYNDSGEMVKDAWVGNYYLQQDGSMAANTWIGGYYFDSNGLWTPDQWILSKGKWWYRHQNGSYTINDFETINDKTYYFDSNGYMVTGWKKIKNKYYYFNKSGNIVKDAWIGNYYLQKDGTMAANTWIGGYYFDSNGLWTPDQWILKNGKYWYRHQNGGYTINNFETINGETYYFDDEGYMTVGWKKVGNVWYYFNKDGHMVEK